MKFVSIILAMGMLIMTGCASAYNHNRVKDNIAERAIIASGSDAQISMLRKGADPSDIVKISAYSSGSDVTVMAAIDILDLEGLSGYVETYGEAPLSSTTALAIDLLAAFGAAYAIYEEVDDNNTVTEVEQPLADIEADGNASPNSEATITTGSGSIVIINNGDGNTFNSGNDDDHSSNQDNSSM